MWAHSCEVRNPWDWFDAGDLLMTNGFSLPEDAGGQVDFVRRSDTTGLSAIAIGEHQQAPPLTDEMVATAEELQFPILLTAYEVPFIALSRVVAESNQHEEQRRLVRTVRLYDRLREWMINDEDTGSLIDTLAKSSAAGCTCSTAAGGRRSSRTWRHRPQRLAGALTDELADRAGPLPAMTRIAVGNTVSLVLPVPSRRATVLVATPRRGSHTDLSLLQHVATIAALQVERLAAEREQALRVGSQLLAHIVDGTLESGSATQQLDAHGLGGEQLVIAACSDCDRIVLEELHHRLSERDLPHLLLSREQCALVLMQGQRASAGVLRQELDSAVPLGLSDPFHGVSRAPDAAREAQWALEAAQAIGSPVVRYGENSPLFLPRTLTEAEAVVTRVIGPLLDYDRDHGTELVESLRVFLTCNRSWQRAAKELFVHKQTLVYRIRRIEELTRRRLDSTADVAELWLALQARDLRLGNSDQITAAGRPGG